jgi:hypothetical protein
MSAKVTIIAKARYGRLCKFLVISLKKLNRGESLISFIVSRSLHQTLSPVP